MTQTYVQIVTNPLTLKMKLAVIPKLSAGVHTDVSFGASILEAVTYVTGERWSNTPSCVDPIITSVLQLWSDRLDDPMHTLLLRGFIVKVINTKGCFSHETTRSRILLDWFLRDYLPIWLDLAGFKEEARFLHTTEGAYDDDTCLQRSGYLYNIKLTLESSVEEAIRYGTCMQRSRAGSIVQQTAGTAVLSTLFLYERTLFTTRILGLETRYTFEDLLWDMLLNSVRIAGMKVDMLTPTISSLQATVVELLDKLIAVHQVTVHTPPLFQRLDRSVENMSVTKRV